MPPVVAAIAAIGAAIGSMGAIAITVGLTVASSLVRKLTSQPPATADFSHDSVTRQVTVRQPIAPWRILYGRTRIGGVITFIDLSGANNDYLHMVITMAGHQVEAIGDVYLDDKKLDLDGSGNEVGQFAGLVRIQKHLGDPNDASQPFPNLVSETGGHWGNDYLQRGCAKLYVRLKWDQGKFPGGIPNVKCDVKGRRVWDPRTDTVAYSENPALCVLDYLNNTEFGLGSPLAEIDQDSFIAAANFCDEDMS